MIKVSDYIFSRLADLGVRDVFMVTGGGAMHLNDSVGKEKRLRYVCTHHEQAAAMAAEGYARVKGSIGVLCVTTGPGGVNALNGVFGAWTDSIPLLVISGQVKRETLMSTYNIDGLRQLGDQEIDILSMVRGITKHAALIDNPQDIRWQLEKAFQLATTGRPGPCWLDVPIDVQSAMVDEAKLKAWDSPTLTPGTARPELREQCSKVLEKLRTSKRPVIIAGTGVRLAGAVDAFEETVDMLGIPVTTAWCHDVIYHDHPCYCGKQGSIGDRAGNFVVQNADVVLIIGSRMPIRQVSYNWENFARNAYKIQVDIDPTEMRKPTLTPDLAIVADARDFLVELNAQIKNRPYDRTVHAEWLSWCKERRAKYPVLLPKHKDPSKPLNPYYFLSTLQEEMNEDDVVVCGDATACIVTFQTSRIKKGQRLFSNSGSASMGYDLPAAIGAAVAHQGKRVICIGGDGSLQMNIQELQTVVHNRLPIKIFVLNNGGYISIKQTQQNFFGRLVGCSPASGVSFPNYVDVGNAFKIPSFRIADLDFIDRLRSILNQPGPALCEVILDPDQGFEPRLSSRQLPDGKMVTAPLEDMFPFLDRKEFESNMIVPTKGS